jgi:hypothetical protein
MGYRQPSHVVIRLDEAGMKILASAAAPFFPADGAAGRSWQDSWRES